MCKLICILTTASNADGFCGSSDPAVLLCNGIWGLLSFIGLIAWVRWEGVHTSARNEPVDKLPELLRKGPTEGPTQNSTLQVLIPNEGPAR